MITNKNIFSGLFKKIGQGAKVCIYGSNDLAEELFEYLSLLRKDVDIKFFADSTKNGELKGLPVYNGQELWEHREEVDTAIIASFSARFYIEVLLKKFGIKNICMLDSKLYDKIKKQPEKRYDINKSANVFKTHKERALYKLIAKGRADRPAYLSQIRKYFYKHYPKKFNAVECPIQHYLEYINKDVIKNVIDGGGYDGFESVLFSDSFRNCEKIFMFEPCYNSFKTVMIDTIINNESRIEIIDKGLWREKTTLEFREETQAKVGSAIVETKQGVTRPHKIIKIDTIDIDSFVQERNLKIDFIKLDVENAELEVLKGAEKVLIQQRPQLAISIYHSDEQFFTIPLYLKKMLKNYEFRFAHYSPRYTESVVYGIPKEKLK